MEPWHQLRQERRQMELCLTMRLRVPDLDLQERFRRSVHLVELYDVIQTIFTTSPTTSNLWLMGITHSLRLGVSLSKVRECSSEGRMVDLDCQTKDVSIARGG